jgi:uncharacterized membrane protein YphA (DoxX/SURF4 family)
LPKLLNAAGTEMFWKIGLPTDLVILIGLLEVISGIALYVGVLTRIPSIFFILDGSTMVATLPGGFVAICSGSVIDNHIG